MVNKIDIAFPFCRKELDRVKRKVDFIRRINDPYTNLVLVANYEEPQISKEEFDYLDPHNYCEKIVIPNLELEKICKKIGYKNLDHYYHITTAVFEWIRINFNKRENKGDCWLWFESDMIPFSLNWVKMLHNKWNENNKPAAFGQWWHGNPFAGLAPTIIGIFSYEISSLDIKWGAWGAYDREILYELNRLNKRFIPTDLILYLNEMRFWYFPEISESEIKEDINDCISKYFNSKISLIHTIEDKDNTVYMEKVLSKFNL